VSSIDPVRRGHYLRFHSAVDPLADAVAAAFAERSAGSGRKMIETALERGIDAVEEPPPQLVALFKQLDTVPLWVDWDRIDRGGELFLRSGQVGIAVLKLYSLPMLYRSAGGNKPLVFSGNLLRRAPRRLAETARFALDTCKPGGLRRFGHGFKTTVRVRLMHAQLRRLLWRSGRWQPSWGEPINQLYMAGTNAAFSVGLLDGLRKLGFGYSNSEADALLHIWRYSGYVSGLDPELQVANRIEGRLVDDLIDAVEGDPDEDSRALITALMNVPYHPRLQEVEWLRDASYGISRALIGNRLADALGYPPSRWSWAVRTAWPFFAAASIAQTLLPGVHAWSAKVGAGTWQQAIAQIMAGAPAEFHPPARLETQPAGEMGG
jgi:hypothetical protein